ncbi:InlB B-repeat-containing protein [Paenibacillus illinoisensis]|uniref:InlB B-repeat-containing protein n=1 Tax=Paenibacillus illinoisensis TaxID=59845 RepID=UPI003A4E1341
MSLPLLKKVSIIWLVFLIGLSGLWNNSSIFERAQAAEVEPYLGEIRLFPYNAIPRGWMPARGQSMSITQNTALYSLLGNNYGGDGKTTFSLPNLSGAAPDGTGYYIAIKGIFPSRDESIYSAVPSVLGEVRIFPYGFTPPGFLAANGQEVSKSTYSGLYEMIGTTYGGDGSTTFKLPNMPKMNDIIFYAISTDPTLKAENGTGNEYIGEIIPMLVSLPTNRWIPANGLTLPINQNQALFSLLGTKFGGDGQVNFNVPNLNSSQSALVYYVANTGVFPTLEGGELPEAIEDNYITNQNTTLVVTAPGVLSNDRAASAAMFRSGPMNGLVVMNSNGSFTYTPMTDYVGTDSFTYSAYNEWGESIPVAVTLTIEQTTAPVISNVTEGGTYNQAVTPRFNSGTALLNGAPFTNGTAVTADGDYTLAVTNSIGTTTIHFTVDTHPPIVTGVTQNGFYTTNPVITFNEGTATLSGFPFNSGDTVQAEGEHVLIVTDRAGNTTTVRFSFHAPRTIHFDSNGGSEVPEQNVNYGDKMNKPDDPTKAGHTFAGWFTDTALSQAFDFNNTPVTTDLTLYAKWSINSYTVNFDSNGGTVVDNQSVPYSELAVAPADPTKAGHTFAGWFTDSALSQAFDFDNTPVTGDITLYAKWSINSYTVNFDSNGGTAVDDQSIPYNELAAAPADPTKDGHTFAGWFTDSGLSQAFDFDNTPVTSDLTLYAKWSINSYTVSFNSIGGTAIDDQSIQYGELAVAPADPTKVGHTFAGWFTDSGLSQAFDFDNTPVTGDLTLYAKWTADKYTISFDTLGGSAVDDVSVEHGSKLTAPASPSRSGYTFSGWYVDAELKTPFDFDQTEMTADLTLYAKWNVIPSPPSGGNGNNSGGSGSQNSNGSSNNSSSSSSANSSTNGRLTLAPGQAGQVSLGNGVTLTIPAGAMNQDLKITIDPVEGTSDLLTNQTQLLSPVYELLKNVTQNFDKPVTLKMAFDGSSLRSNQRAELFYFDEQDKIWLSAGESSMDGDLIQVDVNHFTKFAVFAVDQPNAPVEVTLHDINGHWAEEFIQQAVRDGIVKGYVDGSFKPNASVTRAEFTVMLMNALHTDYAEAPLSFTDRSNIGAWAQSAVARAVQAGFIQGHSSGAFRPNDAVTRAEMAVMVANALQLKAESGTSSTFADNEQIPVWARAAVAGMQQSGLLNGKGLNTFDPRDNTTRAEAVKLLMSMPN